MAFNTNAYNTRQYEVAAIADSATTIAPGTALKISSLPTGLSSPDFYFQVAAASTTDTVFATVSSQGSSISNIVPGRVVLVNSGLIPVIMNSTASKGDLIKVKTTDGKWGKCATGETSDAQLVEAGTMGSMSWATPFKVVAP